MRTIHCGVLASAGLLLACGAWSAEPDGQEVSGTAPELPANSQQDRDFSPPSIARRPALIVPDLSREALVYVRFLVSAEGRPVEMEVDLERGFHSPPFRQAALDYVRGMRFKPATRNGVPEIYGPVTQPFRFGIGLPKDEQGVTPEFRRELGKVQAFLKDEDYAGAQFHAEWMLSEKVKLGYEFAVLKAQLAQTLASVGRLDEALAAAKAATSRSTSESAGYRVGEPPARNDASNYLLPKQVVVPLLDLRMRLHAGRGELLAALKTYNELAGLEPLPADHPLSVLSGQLVGLLQSGRPLGFPGEVPAKAQFWSHELFHRRFTTTDVKGSLGMVHLHCRGGFLEFPYEADTSWNVPEGWDKCVVEFYGEPGATLQLVELPAN